MKPTEWFKVIIILSLFAGCLVLYSPMLLAVEAIEGACPGDTLPFYRLRVEYTTSSDWTRLRIEHPEHVLAIRLMTVHGASIHYDTRTDQLAFGQPLSTAKDGQTIGISVDYALAPEAVHRPLSFLLQQGSLNETQIRMYSLVGKTAQLLKEITHHGAVGGHSKDDPLRFSLELNRTNVAVSCGAMQRVTRERLLLATYYAWYTLKSWSAPMLSDHPITPYESSDPNAFIRHIEAARRAGIDGFIYDWWGPGSYTDQNLRLLLDLAKERNFRISLYFETLADDQGRARSSEEISNWLAYAIATYRDHPAMMKINGKPLIVIWASHSVPLDSWKHIFTKLRTQGLDAVYLPTGFGAQSLEVFDGLQEYNVLPFTIPDLTKIFAETSRNTRFYQLLADGAAPKIWVATVQPGYDERSIPGRKGAFLDREDGAFYRGTFEAAISSDPDWIFITTWNEWYENTQIEPSQLYGAKYLDITREFAHKWKGN